MICSNCGKEIYSVYQYCPNCGIKIINYFTIRYFLRENFHLFTILGVVGTLIVLLSTLGQTILGPRWLIGDSNIVAIFMTILNCFGGFFFIIIFYILFKKILESWKEAEFTENSNILKVGDFDRFIILFCLVGIFVGIFYFIFIVTSMIPNLWSLFFTVVFLLSLGIGIVIFNLKDVLTIERVRDNSDQDHIILRLIPLIALTFFLFFTIGPFVWTLMEPQQPHDVVIETDQTYYSPTISTTVGIKLMPTNSTNFGSLYPKYQLSHFRWITNYGYFVIQNPYTSEIRLLNDVTFQPNANVYWTYPPEDVTKNKPPVNITLDIYSGSDWSFITNTSLNIIWTEDGFAEVKK